MFETADVCLIAEGSYPFVRGGVSTWTHDMIQSQAPLTFHIVSIVPQEGMEEIYYDLPTNVIGHTIIKLQELPPGKPSLGSEHSALMNALEEPLATIADGKGSFQDFATTLDLIGNNRMLGYQWLLDSEAAWALLLRMYERSYSESSFLDYFWSWRSLHGALYSLALAKVPPARMYHALSTGYAGLYAARCKAETQRPMVITEHGIYTNERRIEIASANWLQESDSLALTIDHTRNSLRDLWINSFASYSRIAYEAADQIVTLFLGNQKMQIQDGADITKMQVIPNGIDLLRFGNLPRTTHDRPTIALIGRVVPIKDVKSYIRSVAMLRERMPDIKAYVMGPTDEDELYFEECVEMVEAMGLTGNIEFTGQVQVEQYLPQIDVIVLSSLSEAMPLAVLEAGASGIPSVTTDVGACRELIEGVPDEAPELGRGGIVVPLSSPGSIANAVYQLLSNAEFYAQCGATMRQRVATYYTRDQQNDGYRRLYRSYISGADSAQRYVG